MPARSAHPTTIPPSVRGIMERVLALSSRPIDECLAEEHLATGLAQILDSSRMIAAARTLPWQIDIAIPQLDAPRQSRTQGLRDAVVQIHRAMSTMYPPGKDDVARSTRSMLFDVEIQGIGVRVRGGRRFERLVVTPSSIPWLVLQRIFFLYGDRVRRCRECQGLFIRTKRQTFCSPGCSQRVRSRTWYRKHSVKARRLRRESYVREAKRQNPNLRVASRQRNKADR